MQALVLGFCSSGYDFAIPSSRLHLAMQTLGVAMRFVGNYALCGLSPQTDGMPVILKKSRLNVCSFSVDVYFSMNSRSASAAMFMSSPSGLSPRCVYTSPINVPFSFRLSNTSSMIGPQVSCICIGPNGLAK